MNDGLVTKRRFTVILVALGLWAVVETLTQWMEGGTGISMYGHMSLAVLSGSYFGFDWAKASAKAKAQIAEAMNGKTPA